MKSSTKFADVLVPESTSSVQPKAESKPTYAPVEFKGATERPNEQQISQLKETFKNYFSSSATPSIAPSENLPSVSGMLTEITATSLAANTEAPSQAALVTTDSSKNACSIVQMTQSTLPSLAPKSVFAKKWGKK